MGIRLRELLAARAADAPGHPFVADARSDRVIDYAALATAADTWSRRLDAAGIPAGARVLLDVDDALTFAVVHIALLAAGRCSAPIDPAAPAAEAERARRVLRPSLVLTDRDDRTGVRVDRDGRPPGGADEPGPPGRVDGPGGSAALLTSGSTGTPKTVELTEDQLLHVAGAVARHHRLSPADRGYNPLPLFHINAQVVGLLATLIAGSTLLLDRRFHRTGFWQLLADREVTWVNAVPAILTILAREDVPVVPPGLRFLRSASAPLPTRVREVVTARTGVPVVESYGMTEAASQITATPLDGPHRPGSAGMPVDVELEVVGPDGAPRAPGVVGRVRIRGRGVIRGYAEGGAGAIDDAGWLDTADMGHRDADGYLYLVGRADDVVNRGGELVHPREVEEVLLGDSEVVEAVVVGRPDEVLGQVPVACVRTVPGLDDAAADALTRRLDERCAERLSRFKRPAEILVVDGFPLGPTGKVRRRALRAQLAEGTGRPAAVGR